jgi:ADP-ribosylglycohydrolase
MAVADWLLNDKTRNTQALVDTFVYFANKYPCPMGGYGSGFHRWLTSPDISFDEAVRDDGTKYIAFKEMRKPYNSWGNGSAMRTSAVGWMFDTLEETERIAALQAGITHNHPEGIKGAEATASAIFLARTGCPKERIRAYIETSFGYDLSRSCDEIRPHYRHVASCQETVPEAITAFLEGENFENVIRTAVSLGGDCDTLTAIAGSMAEGFYGVPEDLKAECRARLPEPLRDVLARFEQSLAKRA